MTLKARVSTVVHPPVLFTQAATRAPPGCSHPALPRCVASITSSIELSLSPSLPLFTHSGWSDAPSKYYAQHCTQASVRPSAAHPCPAFLPSPLRQKSSLLPPSFLVARSSLARLSLPSSSRTVCGRRRALELYFTALRTTNEQPKEGKSHVWKRGRARVHKAVAALARGLLMTVAVVDNGGVVLGSTDRDPSVQSVTLPPAGARLPPGHGNVFSAHHIGGRDTYLPRRLRKVGIRIQEVKESLCSIAPSLTHSLALFIVSNYSWTTVAVGRSGDASEDSLRRITLNFTAALSPHENRLLKGGRKKEGGRKEQS